VEHSFYQLFTTLSLGGALVLAGVAILSTVCQFADLLGLARDGYALSCLVGENKILTSTPHQPIFHNGRGFGTPCS